MLLIDANAILRYTLNDNHDMATKVRELISKSKLYVRYEVMAEVVYVLSKVYSLPRVEITDGIRIFLSCDNVETESKEVLDSALETFSTTKMDFVDCILLGFKRVYGYDVFTFDKKLNKLLQTGKNG